MRKNNTLFDRYCEEIDRTYSDLNDIIQKLKKGTASVSELKSKERTRSSERTS